MKRTFRAILLWVLSAAILLGCCTAAAAVEPRDKISDDLRAAMEQGEETTIYKIWLSQVPLSDTIMNQMVKERTGYDPEIYQNRQLFDSIVRPQIEEAVWAQIVAENPGATQEELILLYRRALNLALGDACCAYQAARLAVVADAYTSRVESFIAEYVPAGRRILYRGVYTGTLVLEATRAEIEAYSELERVVRLALYVEDNWSTWGDADPPPQDEPEPEPVLYDGTNFEFTDVSESAYYHKAVQWAINADPYVTLGTSANTFGPEDVCTRAQIMTFLWRAVGMPEPTGSNPFLDVQDDAYYNKAVRWAVENHITAGTGAATFSPNKECTRAEIVTFLWRASGSPTVTGEKQFDDVKDGAYYEKAVQWAVENGITAGSSAGRFSPDANCSRAQAMMFLYKISEA